MPGVEIPDRLAGLLADAWKIRLERHTPQIWFSAPGAKHYENRYYANTGSAFVTISVTGSACTCNCAHCGGKLLESMVQAPTPEQLHNLVLALADKGCQGILISGGANRQGEVPLMPFMPVIAKAVQKGLKVLVHSGLIARETARALKDAGVGQVLIDMIGDQQTIRDVCHLDRRPEDYRDSLMFCREIGLKTAPHVIIGLNYGQLTGELAALQMVKEADPQSLVLVILTPRKGTAMAQVVPLPPEAAAEIIAVARILLPCIPLTLGCAKPAGIYKEAIESLALACGVNAMAYPSEKTVEAALGKGLQPVFSDLCCSLLGIA